MPCIFCPNPALCNPVCRAFEFAPDAVKAQMREACAKSGQMDSSQVSAHVEAGEMPDPRCWRCNDSGWWYSDPLDPSSLEPCCDFPAAKSGEAGEMEAATHPQQEKQ